MSNDPEIEVAKNRLRIPELWRNLNLPNAPREDIDKAYRSPFREDSHPSFSIYREGLQWKDFGTGENGDAIDFLAMAKGISNAEAIPLFIEMAGVRKGSRIPRQHLPNRPKPADQRKGNPKFKKNNWKLREGSKNELQTLAELRDISVPGLELAQDRGLLRFGSDKHGAPLWVVTDKERYKREDRRLDGQPITTQNGGVTKARTLGRGNHLIGLPETQGKTFVVLCEGGPDLLAAHHLFCIHRQIETHAAVAMLGAANDILPEEAEKLSGKFVLIAPDADEAGIASAIRWEKTLKKAGCNTSALNLWSLNKENGDQVKDLNDFLLLDYDYWEILADCQNPFNFRQGG